MADITSSDILNLSHSLKDVCEVDCDTSPCLTKALRTLLEWNLIQANLEYGRRFCSPPASVSPQMSDFQYSYNQHALTQPPASGQPQDTRFRHSLEHRHGFSHEHGTE